MTSIVNWRVFYSLNLAIFTSMLGMGLVIPFMPIYAKTLGATGVSIGLFFASFPLAQIIFMPTIGRLSDRYGRKAFIAAGLLLSSLMALVYVSAPTIMYLTLGRFFQGIAVALILPIATAYVGDLAPAEKRGELMGILNLALMSSVGVGPLAGGWLNDTYGMALSFYLMSGLNALAFLFVLFFLEETRSPHDTAQRSPSYGELLRRPSVRGITLYRIVTAIQMGLWFSFLPLLATEVLHLSQSRIGILMATYMLLSSLVQIPFGRLADRYSKRLLIIVSGYLSSFAFVTIVFSQSFGELLLISAFTGILGALAGPALTALAAGEGKQGGMGAMMGVLNMALNVGMMLGPVLAGLLSDSIGLRPLFSFGAVAGGVGTLVFTWLTTPRTEAA